MEVHGGFFGKTSQTGELVHTWFHRRGFTVCMSEDDRPFARQGSESAGRRYLL